MSDRHVGRLPPRPTNKRDPPFHNRPPTTPYRVEIRVYAREGVMKKIAIASIAMAMLAGTPALARVNQNQQGYYDPSKVRSGDVPFAAAKIVRLCEYHHRIGRVIERKITWWHLL